MPTLVGGASPAGLDYLLGEPAETVELALGGREQWCEPAEQRIERIAGIRVSQRAEGNQVGEKWRYPTESLLAGLAGHGVPVVFVGGSNGAEAQFSIGTWAPPGTDIAYADEAQSVVRSLLDTSYPAVDMGEHLPLSGPDVIGGLVLGVPDPAPPERTDPSIAWDRLLRAVAGGWCQATVVAEPVAEAELRRLRHKVLDEMRTVAMAEQPFGASGGQPPPLVKHYTALLEQLLVSLHECLAGGGWRTAVYLTGAGADYWRLASAWRAVFSGEKSLLQPLRIAQRDEAAALASSWGRPYHTPAAGPGSWRHPFTAQTLLSTRQLSAYIHLPQLEAPGFSVRMAPRFDSVAPVVHGPSVLVGSVVHRDKPSGGEYRVAVRELTRHVLVSGVTGGGKTNTVFQLLDEVDRAGIPFLVLEPAKTEYRTLLDHPRIGSRLHVFTLGDETTAPLRCNPFQPSEGAPLASHVDLLRALFTATWSLWEPLPQVLEQALHEAYRDYGWDLATGANRRLGGAAPTPAAYPTVTDLYDKVEEVVARLRYDPEAEARVRASLLSRLQSLRVGAKGHMLDVQEGFDPAVLFERPTVLELERMGDEGDRAFLMGLLLIRLGEYRRTQGYHDSLRHVLVLEEAHRLLANAGGGGKEDQGNPVAKAIEGFVNLLAEVRVYGEGVIISDQVPVKLAPDAVKNTNLKITHRLLANDDRVAVGGATAMDERQRDFLPTLRPGQAAVFSDGDDSPVLVQVPVVKDLGRVPADDEVRARAAALAPSGWSCGSGCSGPADVCAQAREVSDDARVRREAERLVNTALVDEKAALALWPDVVAAARADHPDIDRPEVAAAVAAHVASRYVKELGGRHAWSYEDTALMTGAMRALVVDGAVGAVGELVGRLLRRAADPFPACDRICPDGSCPFRVPVARSIARGTRLAAWRQAGTLSLDERYAELVEVGLDVADELVAPVEGAHARVAMCFNQQLIVADVERGPGDRAYALEQVVIEGGTR